MIDRRAFIIGSAALAVACSETMAENRTVASNQVRPSQPDFERLQGTLGESGRLGVAALDTGTGRWLLHDENGLYAMVSTFKLSLAAAILGEVEAGRLALDREIPFTRPDLVSYSPVVEANLERGRLPLERLCAAIVEISDNAAANLLLARIGGPAGLTRFIRANGDTVTRLDRTEPELNSNLPGDERDTTSPLAMVGLMRTLLLGEALRPASRARLIGWMESASTGLDRLRAGLPPGWRVGNKTGTGNGANNDIAIAVAPGRAPILIACYTSGANNDRAARNAVHAEIARMIGAAFA